MAASHSTPGFGVKPVSAEVGFFMLNNPSFSGRRFLLLPLYYIYYASQTRMTLALQGDAEE